MAYLSLDGSSGTYVSTPDAAVLRVTGDLDLRVRAALPDWTPLAGNALIAKRNAPTSGAYSMLFNNNGLRLDWSANGTSFTTANVATPLPLVNGTVGWVRVTLDVDNGAGGYDVDFYYSAEQLDDSTGVTWTQLGSTVTGGATTSIASENSVVSIGRLGTTATWPLTGDVYRAQIYDGIGGTLVFDADPSDPTTWDCPDKLFFTEKANGATVTLQGDAELVGACPSPGGGNRIGGTGAIRRSPVGR